MKFKRFKWDLPMIILLVVPYLFVIILGTMLFFNGLSNAVFCIALGMYGTICLFFFLPNMIYAFMLPKKGYTARQMLFWDMLLKICNIPIYIIVFLNGLLLAITPMGFLLIFILIIFDYTLLLPSTMYGISGLIQVYKEGLIQKKKFIIHVILHFVFCLDVVSAVISYLRIRKEKIDFDMGREM